MEKIKLENICKITEVDTDEVSICFSDFDTHDSNFEIDGVVISNNLYTKNIQINKEHKPDDLILKDIISFLIDKNIKYESFREDMYFHDIYAINVLEDSLEESKLVGKILSNLSNIAHMSRYGPGIIVIFPLMFQNFKFKDAYDFKLYHSEILRNKIICLRYSEDEYNNEQKINYIKNKSYYNIDIGNSFTNFYTIIDIISLKQERLDKLERILN